MFGKLGHWYHFSEPDAMDSIIINGFLLVVETARHVAATNGDPGFFAGHMRRAFKYSFNRNLDGDEWGGRLLQDGQHRLHGWVGFTFDKPTGQTVDIGSSGHEIFVKAQPDILGTVIIITRGDKTKIELPSNSEIMSMPHIEVSLEDDMESLGDDVEAAGSPTQGKTK